MARHSTFCVETPVGQPEVSALSGAQGEKNVIP